MTGLGMIRSCGIPVSPKRIIDIRIIASKIRDIFGMTDKTYCNIPQILEYFGSEFLPDYGYEVIPDIDSSLNGKLAETIPQKNIIRIKESVYEKACEGDGQSRFTIAHELGHLFLRHKEDISFSRQMQYSSESLKPWRDSEWQADVFAAELLMPYSIVKNMNTQEIIKSCGVSFSAAETRRQKLKQLNWQ